MADGSAASATPHPLGQYLMAARALTELQIIVWRSRFHNSVCGFVHVCSYSQSTVLLQLTVINLVTLLKHLSLLKSLERMLLFGMHPTIDTIRCDQ